MSNKSKKSEIAVDRLFAATTLAEARKIAGQYQIVLSHEDGEYYGHSLELPNVFGDGKTPTACVNNTLDATAIAVATMLEAGETPPLPAHEGKRTEQVNIRLSVEEKTIMESKAKQRGFRGLGDFIRTAALAQ